MIENDVLSHKTLIECMFHLKISTKNKILLLEEYNDEKYIYDNFEIIQKDRSILTVRYDKNEEMNKVYQSIDYMK